MLAEIVHDFKRLNYTCSVVQKLRSWCPKKGWETTFQRPPT